MHSPAPLTLPVIEKTSDGSSRQPVVIAIFIFAVLSCFASIKSDGFITGDACMHYLSARYAFSNPKNFVDVWNRPAVTALYAVPAVLGGRIAVRFVAMLAAIGCAWVAMRIAQGQGARLPTLALLFTLGQPLLFLHSFGEMTELPFALLLGLAFLAWQSGRWWLATAIAAWLPLARPEGFGLALIWLGFLLLHRKWRMPFLLGVPLLLWDLAGWELTGRGSHWYRWLIDNWPYAGQSLYPRGSIFTFLAVLPAVISPAAMPAMWIGVWRKLRREHDGFFSPRKMTAAIPLFVLTVHSLLYALGKMASYGEARYLLVVAPFWGVLSAAGWEWTFLRFNWGRPLLWAGVAALAPVLIASIVDPVVPVSLDHDWQSARQIVQWYESRPISSSHPKVMAAHPGIFYFLNVDPYASPRVRGWDHPTLNSRSADTVLIWDPIYSGRNASARYVLTLEDIRSAGWIEIDAPPIREETAEAYRGAVAPAGDPAYAWHVFIADPLAETKSKK